MGVSRRQFIAGVTLTTTAGLLGCRGGNRQAEGAGSVEQRATLDESKHHLVGFIDSHQQTRALHEIDDLTLRNAVYHTANALGYIYRIDRFDPDFEAGKIWIAGGADVVMHASNDTAGVVDPTHTAITYNLGREGMRTTINKFSERFSKAGILSMRQAGDIVAAQMSENVTTSFIRVVAEALIRLQSPISDIRMLDLGYGIDNSKNVFTRKNGFSLHNLYLADGASWEFVELNNKVVSLLADHSIGEIFGLGEVGDEREQYNLALLEALNSFEVTSVDELYSLYCTPEGASRKILNDYFGGNTLGLEAYRDFAKHIEWSTTASELSWPGNGSSYGNREPQL